VPNKLAIIVIVLIALATGLGIYIHVQSFTVIPAESTNTQATELEFDAGAADVIDLKVGDSAGFWPLDTDLNIHVGGTFVVSDGTQAITMTGPITITRIEQ
jgi:hypothetical protein